MRQIFIRAAFAAAMASAIAVTAGCGAEAASADAKSAQAKADETPAVPVEVGAVKTGTLDPQYASTANIEALREAKIVAEVPGEIIQILVEEGDHVAAGQVLARIDASRAELQWKQDQSLVARMDNDTRRNESLIARHMISRDAYDRARFDRETQVAAANLSRLSVTKAVIRAPYAGVITRRQIKQGQWLETNAVAFEIADFTALRARFDVPERAARLIQPGQPVRFSADALAGREFTATIERVSPVVDRATGTVAATVSMDNAEGVLRPGLFVRLAVTYDHIDDAVLMPKHAVVSDAGMTHVFVVQGDKVARREVRLGLESGEHVQVLAGVDSGSQVVTVGQQGLKDGDRIAVVNAGAAANATASL